MLKKRYILLSLALHLLPIVLMLFLHGGGSGGGNGEEGKDGKGRKLNGVDANIVPKPIKDEPVEVELKVVEGIPLKKKIKRVPHEEEKCDNFFGGIGVTIHQGFTSDRRVVTFFNDVYPGYPAHNAGIRPGDIVVDGPAEIRGEIGTEIQLTVMSGGEVKTLTLVRDKICIDKPVQEQGP